MIHLTVGPEPQVLLQNKNAWTMEYVTWLNQRNGSEPRRYTHDAIRAALRFETASKCAYCEGHMSDVSYDHIEHIRPKKKYPGLVCAWDNLTVACQVCNTNKGDFDSKECPLLNPYIDDPESEIAFGGPLAIPRGGPRSRITISTLDLNRVDLLFARKERLQHIIDLLDLIEQAKNQVAVQTAMWSSIDELTSDGSEFASACRYFVRAECEQRGLSRQ